VLALASAGRGAADEPRHSLVQLQIDACVEVSQADARRFLAIELGALLNDAGAAGDTTRASANCAGALVTLRVDDPITGKSLARSIDLRTTPPRARARLLALAVSELISASWTELESNPQPSIPPVERVSSPESRKSALLAVEKRASRHALGLRVLALFGGQLFFTRAGLLLGGGVRVGQDRVRGFGWSADLLAHHGSTTTSLGLVAVDTVSVGPTAIFHRNWSKVALRVGGGVRGGAVRLDGMPNAPQVRGTSAWSGWLGPMVGAATTVTVARHLAFELSVEGGYVAVPFGGLVSGAREVEIDGPWIGFQLGLGFFP